MSRDLDRSIVRELERPIDMSLKLTPTHHNILNFAVASENILVERSYRESVQGKENGKALWASRRKSIKRLEDAGYLVFIGEGRYQINPLAIDLLRRSRADSFAFGNEHRRLIEHQIDGVITLEVLRKPLRRYSERVQERKYKIIKGMVRSLAKQGYLEADANARGVYRLTEKALRELSKPSAKRSSSRKPSPFQFTAFDKVILEIIQDGRVDQQRIEAHPRRDQIEKRLEAFRQNGLLQDEGLNEQLAVRIELAVKRAERRSTSRTISSDLLTQEQLGTLSDIRTFQSLTADQIIRYFYAGDGTLAEMDLAYLVKEKIIAKDAAWNAYYLLNAGVRLTDAINLGGNGRYKTKLHNKRDEVMHDLALYTAYQGVKAQFEREGKRIISVQTDRDMRSESAKADGSMHGAYPDLRIHYETAAGERGVHDLELDRGYSYEHVAKKLSQTNHSMSWVATTSAQAAKVGRIAKGLEIHSAQQRSRAGLLRARTLYIYVMGAEGELIPVKW